MVPSSSQQGTGGSLGLLKGSEFVNERASCHQTATNIQMAVLLKVRSALCATSQLPGEGPTDVKDATAH